MEKQNKKGKLGKMKYFVVYDTFHNHAIPTFLMGCWENDEMSQEGLINTKAMSVSFVFL